MKVHFYKFTHVLLHLLVVAGLGAIVMWLWNWLMPAIAGWAGIDFWQALGLLALARILLGGFDRGWMHYRHRHHNPFHEKWIKMTPEERKDFIRKRHRCICGKHDFPFEGNFGAEKKEKATGENE
ncbi:MAG: hypothetical protein LBF85_04855 [Tannerella sp.]|jgi:hypothetical protein|nr:hypothetical protein [Tannerella sp.]